MLRHTVLFNLDPGVDDADRETLFGRIRSLSTIESVRRLGVGSVLKPREAAYRKHMSSDYEYALFIEFDGEDGLYAYQRDPAHVTASGELRKRAAAIEVLDFEFPE